MTNANKRIAELETELARAAERISFLRGALYSAQVDLDQAIKEG